MGKWRRRQIREPRLKEQKDSCNWDMDDGKIDRRGRLKVAAFSNGKNQASGSFCLIEEMVDPVRRGFKEEKEKRGCSRGVQPLFFSRQSHLSEKNDAARKDAKYAKFRE